VGGWAGARVGLVLTVEKVDAHVSLVGKRADDYAQSGGGAPTSANHASYVVGVHSHLKHAPAARLNFDHLDVIGVINHTAH
jgi:hypothetical protein